MAPAVRITRERFLEDRQGRTFSDILNGRKHLFEEVLAFFNDAQRQRRMEEAEMHHDRPALAGVVRELEAQPAIHRFFASENPRRTKRLRQAIGVVVRIIMEERGWQKTGKKGSLGVRAKLAKGTGTPAAYHNTGGLAFWFLRAERYKPIEGTPFRSVRERSQEIEQVAEE